MHDFQLIKHDLYQALLDLHMIYKDLQRLLHELQGVLMTSTDLHSAYLVKDYSKPGWQTPRRFL